MCRVQKCSLRIGVNYMIKSELLELINEIDNEGDVDAVLDGLLTLDKFKNKLDEKEFKAFLDSEKDKYSAKAINTALENYKKKELPKVIADEIAKAKGEPQTEQEKQLLELQKKVEIMEKEKARAEMTSKYKSVLSEKSIPVDMIDFLLAGDDDTTISNIDLFEKAMNKYVEDKVTERLSNSNYEPKSNKDDKGKLSLEDMASMSIEEINKNWDNLR